MEAKVRLTMKERQSVTAVVAGRYRKAGKKGKGQILDEFSELTGYNRSYASWEVIGSQVSTACCPNPLTKSFRIDIMGKT